MEADKSYELSWAYGEFITDEVNIPIDDHIGAADFGFSLVDRLMKLHRDDNLCIYAL